MLSYMFLCIFGIAITILRNGICSNFFMKSLCTGTESPPVRLPPLHVNISYNFEGTMFQGDMGTYYTRSVLVYLYQD